MGNKIMVLLNSFWTRGTVVSGGDQIAVKVMKRISCKFDMVVWVSNKSGKKFIQDRGCEGEYIICADFLDSMGVVVSYLLRILFVLFKPKFYSKYKVIFSSSDFLTDVLPGYVYKILNPKVNWVASVYHIYPSYKKRQGSGAMNLIAELGQKISFCFIKKADSIIVVNGIVKKELASRGFKNRIEIIYPGIDFEKLEKIKGGEQKFDAIFMSRLKPSKGIFDLIDIWQKVVQEIPDANLAIIGGGEEKIMQELKLKIKEKGLECNAQLMGYLEDKQTYSLIKFSKLFLMPSHEEGFCVVIAEAMALGVPVIAWDLPVYSEVFEDKIVKVKEKDINQFSQKNIKLLKDDYTRDKIGKEGYEYIQKYDWRPTVNNYLEILCR